jgi:hypothetical protein
MHACHLVQRARHPVCAHGDQLADLLRRELAWQVSGAGRRSAKGPSIQGRRIDHPSKGPSKLRRTAGRIRAGLVRRNASPWWVAPHLGADADHPPAVATVHAPVRGMCTAALARVMPPSQLLGLGHHSQAGGGCTGRCRAPWGLARSRGPILLTGRSVQRPPGVPPSQRPRPRSRACPCLHKLLPARAGVRAGGQAGGRVSSGGRVQLAARDRVPIARTEGTPSSGPSLTPLLCTGRCPEYVRSAQGFH